MPDIHEINKTSLFLRNICDSLVYDDEETENTGLFANTISGYEYREYVRDSQKISWKLSSKKVI